VNRIPTERSLLRKLGAAVWETLEDNIWLLPVLVGIGVLIANFPK